MGLCAVKRERLYALLAVIEALHKLIYKRIQITEPGKTER